MTNAMNGSGRAGCGDPGIGPHHVDPAIPVDRLADQTLDVRLDAPVCDDAMGGSARGFDLSPLFAPGQERGHW
jgi:hypothetical protein